MMKSKIILTTKDIFVILVCLIFLLINAVAISSNGRSRAKRAVCLTNLKRLTFAWTQFAEDNDGFIVNGAPMGIFNCQAYTPTSGVHANEKPWIGRDWADSHLPSIIPKDCGENAIRDGALWPYCKDLKLYHCPSGYSYELRNYSIVAGMNGIKEAQTTEGIEWIKKMEQIRRPTRRAVFIDEGRITPDSYTVHYSMEMWWDPPPVRHSDGTTLSFADGHTEYWKWKGTDTIAYGTSFPPVSNVSPTTPEGMDDLHRLQIAVWGKLGYSPH